MTITEEQREAIKYAISSLEQCGSEPEDPVVAKILGAMIDGSEHFSERTKMIGFDLEKNRAAIDSAINSLLCEGRDNEASTVRRLVAEIERLRANNEYLQTMIDEAHDLMNGTHLLLAAKANECDQQAAKIRDLEENCIYDPEDGKIFVPDGHPEIERLRTQIISKDARIKELEADLEQAERVIEARLEVIDQQAALTKSLKKEIRRLKHESKVEQELTNSYIKHLHEAEARIKELEEAHKRSGAKYAKIINELRSSVYANIPGLDVGKIGPDATKPRSWQITEERMRAIRMAEELAWDCKAVAVLRAMLKEAGL